MLASTIACVKVWQMLDTVQTNEYESSYASLYDNGSVDFGVSADILAIGKANA